MSRHLSVPAIMALITRKKTSTKPCLQLIFEPVSSTRVRCSINVMARLLRLEEQLDHRKFTHSNFVNIVCFYPRLTHQRSKKNTLMTQHQIGYVRVLMEFIQMSDNHTIEIVFEHKCCPEQDFNDRKIIKRWPRHITWLSCL